MQNVSSKMKNEKIEKFPKVPSAQMSNPCTNPMATTMSDVKVDDITH